MPAGDGTGPMGFGTMTGRGAGYCAGFSMPGYMNLMPGRGWGMGRGWRHGYYPLGVPVPPVVYGFAPSYPAPSAEHEAQALRVQAEHLEGTLDEIRRRIAELEATQKKEG
jgi:hypothetical protein